MPVIPIRDLGAIGIVQDVSPFTLPPNAFSSGINVRFENGKVQRSPVFRVIWDKMAGTDLPTGCYGIYNQNSFDQVLYATNEGRLHTVANWAETNVTEAGHVDNVAATPWTFTTLSQCTYANRADQIPVYMGPAMTQFAHIPGWTSTWRCASLRSFKNFLIALNVTKGATVYPNLFKWSDVSPGDTPPASWDHTDATKLAGENFMSQLRTPIVDGGPLGDNFIVYTHDEAWMVEYIAGNLIFRFRRLPFENVGILNQNCLVEIGSKHYCWSENDIYVHDGVTKKSIMDKRNRVSFFRDLNLKRAPYFFIAHDIYRHEIIFCGTSGNDIVNKTDTPYCNYGAVYNYNADTWSFIDLPNVTASSLANANTVWTYQDIDPDFVTQPGPTPTYENCGGTYFDQDDSYSRYATFTSCKDTATGYTASKVLFLDGANFGKIALAADSESAYTAYAQRVGLDLDEAGADLRGYKHVKAMMPQIALSVPSALLDIRMGGHLTSAAPVDWDTPTAFDPSVAYKIDTRRGGRYLSYQFSMTTANDFDASGFDLDVAITGKR